MSEIEPPVINKELTDQKPFLIRGHHLWDFSLLSKGKSPTELSSAMMESIAKSDREYVQDVWGSYEHADVDKYKDRLEEIYETFIKLPDNYPTEIIEDMPDNICSACAIGQHCKMRPLIGTNSDKKYVEAFISVFDDPNLPKPTIVWQEAHFSDGEPQQVRRVRTTIGVVREVLRERNSAFREVFS